MKLGLLGYPLGHSYSKEIHEFLIDETYEMFEVPENELNDFMEKRNFDGINVTIPYKQKVIEYLDEISEDASEVSAINCVVNKNGKLIGYNTDVLGFGKVIDKNGIDVYGKKVAILGSGGASKACRYSLEERGAEVYIVSRNQREGVITYEELHEKSDIFNIIVNATPVGLYPNIDNTPSVDLDAFNNLEALIDIIANPIRTKLMFEAKVRGIKAYGGIEMLVYQAAYADNIFLNKEVNEEKADACLKNLLLEKGNILLIGMPTSGKSVISKELAKELNLEVIDMDEELEKILGMSIKECFETKGESYFRKEEKELAKSLANIKNKIISSGGGVVKDKETMQYLMHNSVVIWIDRDIDNLIPSEDRPLSSNIDDLKRLYDERYCLYEKYSDYKVINNDVINKTIEEIKERLGKNI